MVLTTLVVASWLAPASLVCPISGEKLGEDAKTIDYAGLRVGVCCASCEGTFAKDPAGSLQSAQKKGWIVAESLFDPTTGMRALKSRGTSDYKGVRWNFASLENKAKFDKAPAKFTVSPKQDALFCPVASEAINGYATACGYQDYEGVRYYICCQGCWDPFKKDPAKYAPNAKAAVAVPAIHNVDPNKRHEDKPE